MKKMNNLLLLLLILFMASCGNTNQHNPDSASGVNITPDQLSAKIDPVCKMSLENHVIADTTLYQGKIYGFCSSGCKDEFVENPSKYLSDL